MLEFVYYWLPALRSIVGYVTLGGPIVLMILIMACFLWYLVVERFYYIKVILPNEINRVAQEWKNRTDHSSWYAHKIRDQLISQIKMNLREKMDFVYACVMIAPLAGLIGTVTGMIRIFQTLSYAGSTDVRQMASGVYQAIIPTLTGMSVAVLGLLLSSWLRHRQDVEVELLEDSLEIKRVSKTGKGGR
ncbi:MAG: MotA/TolQ/ExbB proton channel family protein [Methylacidiphilales bacterium]|nr:MotA/TolQ/ExbB proton channel family protein [Candidatus Methylacidiphilales bacterium]